MRTRVSAHPPRALGAAALPTAALVLLALAGSPTTVAAAPTGPTRTYVVTTSSVRATSAAVADLQQTGGRLERVYRRVLPGYSATLTAGQAAALRARAGVVSVTADGQMRSSTTQTDPTWGLDRIDQRPVTGDGTYSYTTTGAGTTAYVVDSGIRTTHAQFGGRAVSGYDFVDDDANASDCYGHGTHVAGTIAGSRYGVAKGSKVVGVRVLDCEGSGAWSGLIAALDWVVTHRSGPAVVNLSLGGGVYEPVDEAVANTVAAGVPVVIAAGNDGEDACGSSPARAPAALTVAATDRNDRRASFSNHGSCVDLFAPGVDVLSAWNTSDRATKRVQGTSMAAPHVAGVVARHYQSHPDATPAQVRDSLLDEATPGAVSDTASSPNKLAYAAATATAPLAPVSVTARKNDKARTATIAWRPPASDGGSRVTSYVVQRSGKDLTGVGPAKVVLKPGAKSHSFAQLRRSTSYTLSVRAVNAVGAGQVTSRKVTLQGS